MVMHKCSAYHASIMLMLLSTYYAGVDPEFGKRGGGGGGGGGTLLKKVEEQKKKITTIIASYPLPNIFYHVCYVK